MATTVQPKKLPIVNIIDILNRHTDSRNTLTQREIEQILKDEYLTNADRKDGSPEPFRSYRLRHLRAGVQRNHSVDALHGAQPRNTIRKDKLIGLSILTSLRVKHRLHVVVRDARAEQIVSAVSQSLRRFCQMVKSQSTRPVIIVELNFCAPSQTLDAQKHALPLINRKDFDIAMTR